jgi:hypothetical protein
MSKSDLKSATSENRAAVQSSIKTRQESTLSRAKDRQQKTRDVTSRFNNSNISPSYRSNFSTYSTHVHTYYHDPITSNPYYWMYLSQLNQRHETQTLVLNGSTGETYEANAKALEKIELEMSNLDVSVEKFFGVVERMDGIHEALAGYPEDTKLIDSATAAVHQAQAHLDEAKAAADQNNPAGMNLAIASAERALKPVVDDLNQRWWNAFGSNVGKGAAGLAGAAAVVGAVSAVNAQINSKRNR